MIYLHIYPSTYNLYVKMTSPKKILVHIQDPNSELNWLWYFDDFYFTYVILGMIICVCPNVHHMIISEMLFYDMYIIRYNKLWSLWYWTEILWFYMKFSLTWIMFILHYMYYFMLLYLQYTFKEWMIQDTILISISGMMKSFL